MNICMFAVEYPEAKSDCNTHFHFTFYASFKQIEHYFYLLTRINNNNNKQNMHWSISADFGANVLSFNS